uniref:SUMF1/EgtB/PvdO family nonheme iron enzyme n=1 Tax=Sphingomonas sp. BE123 TaxID=2817842 RepID=UPI003865A797
MPDSNLDGLGEHPPVDGTYQAAQAYAGWAGRALSTKAERERAAHPGGGMAECRASYSYGHRVRRVYQ